MILRKKILVVEDNNDFGELLANLLNHCGYDVIQAGSGIAAINHASEKQPDLILMDICLPEMTGDEITACLKAHPSTRHIPVIVTTAFQDLIVTKRARAAGAAEILRKPFSLIKLREILDKYLSTDAGRYLSTDENKER